MFQRPRAGPREMPQGRSVEALRHDAEAPVQRHLAEHLRHRDAGGAHGADHAYLVPAEQMRDAGLEQLYDLTGRPGVGFGEGAFTDLFPQRSLHARSPPCRGNTGGAQKGRAAGHYDRLSTCAETFVHSAKWSQESGFGTFWTCQAPLATSVFEGKADGQVARPDFRK